MAFLRNKKCKGNDYYVMVENRRVNEKMEKEKNEFHKSAWKNDKRTREIMGSCI